MLPRKNAGVKLAVRAGTTMTTIEHANITVPDIDAALAFMRIVAPDFKVKKDAIADGGYRWVHVGNDEHYLAFQEAHIDSTPEYPKESYRNFGVNHLGLVVRGLDAIKARLLDAGYTQGMETPSEPFRQRVYFYDSAGFEWELIEYASAIASEKFLYE